MATAQFAHGSKLKFESVASSGTYTEIPLAGDISFAEPKADKIPIKDHSDSSGYKKYIVGLRDGGKVGVKISLDPANTTQQALWAANGTIRNFQVWPAGNASGRQFAAMIDLSHDLPEDKQWEVTIALDITGAVTTVTS